VIDSARTQAAAILRAWSGNNLELLHHILAAAVEESQLPAADSGEGERLEMLAAIADNMRVLVESDELYRAEQYRPLLRHLATTPRPSVFEYAYSC
jgi:hypothetical protein